MPTYDKTNLVITLDSGVTLVEWADVYSDWKDWSRDSVENRKCPQAFESTGGDDVTDTLQAGGYIKLRNDLGWRIKPPEEDISIYATGNLIPYDTSLPILLPTTGGYTAGIFGLQPITQVVVQNVSGLTPTESAALINIQDDVDSLAAAFPELAGLMQKNYYMDQAVYDDYNGTPLLVSGRMRTYTDAISVGTASNVLATYLITATWNNNELETYKVVKQ